MLHPQDTRRSIRALSEGKPDTAIVIQARPGLGGRWAHRADKGDVAVRIDGDPAGQKPVRLTVREALAQMKGVRKGNPVPVFTGDSCAFRRDWHGARKEDDPVDVRRFADASRPRSIRARSWPRTGRS